MNKHIFTLVVIVLFAAIINSCDEPDPKGNITGIVKDEVSNNIIENAGVELFLNDLANSNTTTDSKGSFDFIELDPATYTLKINAIGYLENSASVTVKDGQTAPVNILLIPSTGKPEITTQAPVNITSETASILGNITNTGNAEITEYGHCWSLTPAPDISHFKVNYGTTNSTIEFTSTLSNLAPETKYFVRAYATNSHGTGYSTEMNFTTLSGINTPSLTTSSITSITDVGAVCGGNITSNGGATITERGVCWSTTEAPTIADNRTMDGVGTGIFTSNLSGLSPSTAYYVRAYAINSSGKTTYANTVKVNKAAGTGYGNQLEFTTLASIAVPSLTTTVITSITDNSAISGGSISTDGGAPIIERGVCWSEYENPTISDEQTNNGTGVGNYSSTITGLTPGKTYYVRAYATNSLGKTAYSNINKAVGTGYGEQRSFTTLSILPTLTTTEVQSITDISAISGGDITNDGGASISARGICWSTSINPTIAGNHTTDGTGTGSFSSSMTGLTFLTVYYVRAYATNSTGTAYGEQKSFTTTAKLPTLTTSEVTSITENTATCGGNITNNGGAEITARGVCWSTTPNPTAFDSHTTDGTGTGSFTSSLTGLTPSTTYYVRAYATNSTGTSYGDEKTFIKVLPATLTTTEVTSITESTAISGGDITDDGGGDITARGVCWSTSQNPTISDSHTTDGTGTGSFTSALIDLAPGTTFYVRAYAINSASIAYGQNISFITQTGIPTITTLSITKITQNSASSGGDINSDGGSIITEKGVCWSTIENPTVSDSHTTDGTGAAQFTSNITGLSENTTYYIRAYATNSFGTAYGENLSFTTIEPVSDYEGNIYQTVKIGNQIWMAENLKATHYADGTAIPLVTDNTAWVNLADNNTDDAYCYYNNDANSEYGALYTWAAALNSSASSSANPSGIQGACPDGWHVPSDAEWTELSDYLGGASLAGDKMKESGTTHWSSLNTGATNESGFTALPGGLRIYTNGSFNDAGDSGRWWSSTDSNPVDGIFTYAYYRTLGSNSATLSRYTFHKSFGYSVRCVKD